MYCTFCGTRIHDEDYIEIGKYLRRLPICSHCLGKHSLPHTELPSLEGLDNIASELDIITDMTEQAFREHIAVGDWYGDIDKGVVVSLSDWLFDEVDYEELDYWHIDFWPYPDGGIKLIDGSGTDDEVRESFAWGDIVYIYDLGGRVVFVVAVKAPSPDDHHVPFVTFRERRDYLGTMNLRLVVVFSPLETGHMRGTMGILRVYPQEDRVDICKTRTREDKSLGTSVLSFKAGQIDYIVQHRLLQYIYLKE